MRVWKTLDQRRQTLYQTDNRRQTPATSVRGHGAIARGGPRANLVSPPAAAVRRTTTTKIETRLPSLTSTLALSGKLSVFAVADFEKHERHSPTEPDR
jgi:hypothetical protein